MRCDRLVPRLVNEAKEQKTILKRLSLTHGKLPELLGKWYIIRWTGNIPIPAKKKLSPLPPFTFVRNIIGKLEFRMNLLQPTGCIEFKIYLDRDKDNPNTFYIWPKHRIYIMFLGGKDFAIAFHVSKINKTHVKMAMFIGHNMVPKRTMLLDFEDTIEYLGLNRADIINPRCDGGRAMDEDGIVLCECERQGSLAKLLLSPSIRHPGAESASIRGVLTQALQIWRKSNASMLFPEFR
ncbi:uncharacterized protein LOC119819745 [Arvicola amphibius]|uniref:uncharacterized protein LOC119819745 n=1 Tax=Arvicola amphibius TaxID=1047088 RepID=UPI001C091A61|nr:uncharacterized protein LOC119819745 [Arvicola amphibius]